MRLREYFDKQDVKLDVILKNIQQIEIQQARLRAEYSKDLEFSRLRDSSTRKRLNNHSDRIDILEQHRSAVRLAARAVGWALGIVATIVAIIKAGIV